MYIQSRTIAAFRRKVLAFYQERGRSLPWRMTRDPYRILVSEVMLQQTQAGRVIPFYKEWVRRWPTIGQLASASRLAVLREWAGLGYNSRAVSLHRSAGIISRKYRGNLLLTLKKENLPGIGPYTRRAVEIFSRNSDQSAVDTNIRRILIHEFALPENIPGKELQAIAAR